LAKSRLNHCRSWPASVPRLPHHHRRTRPADSVVKDRPSRVCAASSEASSLSCRVPIGANAVGPAHFDTHTRQQCGSQPGYTSLARRSLSRPALHGSEYSRIIPASNQNGVTGPTL